MVVEFTIETASAAFAVTVPAMVWVAGKLEMETTLPLTALVMLEIAVEPKETTVWATICSPPVTTEERVAIVRLWDEAKIQFSHK